MCGYRGMVIEYLPPYSPDYNPIEQGFSAMKAWIYRHRDYVLDQLANNPKANPFNMLTQAVLKSMVPDSIEGWYRDAGW
jgi:transposase